MKLVLFILLFLLLSLYCIRSNKHLVNIWTMSTMWRLMLTWGIILELLNNQSQTSHHIDAYITPGTVEQSVVNILTSFNADIDFIWLQCQHGEWSWDGWSVSRDHLDQGRCGKWKQVAALFGVKDVTVLGARVPWWSIPDEKSKRSSNWMCRLSRKPQILFRMFP